MIKNRQNQGITLIALVITIVVMLILVGVTISVSLKGGLFSTAKEATAEMQIEIEKEQLLTATLGALGRNGKVNFDDLDNNLPDGFTKISEGKYESSTGNKYQVTEDADINLVDENGEEEEEETETTVTPTIAITPETITGEIESGTTGTEVGTITATVSNVDGDLVWSITPTDSGLELVDTDNANIKKITASKAVENATITVSYGTASDTCSVTVTEKEAETSTVTITSAEISPTSFSSRGNHTVNLSVNIEKSIANQELIFTYKFYDAYSASIGDYTVLDEMVFSSSDVSTYSSKTIDFSSHAYYSVTLEISDTLGDVLATHSFDGNADFFGYPVSLYASCLPAGTMVTVEIEEEDEKGKKKKRRKRKKIEDLDYDDDLVVWDFDKGCITTAKPLWLMKKQVAEEYNLLKFDDGTELRTIRQHRIFNKQLGKFTYPMTEETPIGTTTFNEEGKEVKLISKEVVKEEVEYYNVISNYHINVFAEGILTSCRLSNLYDIKDMKYVKDNKRELNSREEYKEIPDEYYYGLRIAEQPKEINRGNDDKNTRTLKEYVLNCIKTQKEK